MGVSSEVCADKGAVGRQPSYRKHTVGVGMCPSAHACGVLSVCMCGACCRHLPWTDSVVIIVPCLAPH